LKNLKKLNKIGCLKGAGFMLKLIGKHFSIILLLIICLIISGCGGNSGIVSGTVSNPVSNDIISTPTPTPVLIQKPAEGYLLVTNSVTDEGDNVENLKVFDVPATKPDESGNQPFIQQLADTLKEDPQTWNSPQIQELYNQLNSTLSQSQPLTVYASNASVYSSYQDSENATPIPVNADGKFNSQILTEVGNSSTELEVAINDDNYLNVETVTGGDMSSSCNDVTPGLKACPSKIMTMPGDVVEFKVYAYPNTNLKDAGLTFTLNDTSLGCISPPIYLCKNGKKSYSQADGCFYAKKGLTTPVSTTITVKTSDLQIEIPVEIVKTTASISGTVYTGGAPLVRGHVKSFGPKSCSRLDENGNYSLKKVFKAHNVKVRATWWTSENGKKIRHREEKVIDFLNSDLTGFNFGVPPTPTPTSTPGATPTPRPDIFYADQTLSATLQFEIWKKELGIMDATRKTVNWLNREEPGPAIPEGITGACISYLFGPNPSIFVHFDDGESFSFYTGGDDWFGSYPGNNNITVTDDINQKNKIKKTPSLQSSNSEPVYFTPAKIFIRSPFEWQVEGGAISTDNIVNELDSIGFTDYDSKILHSSEIDLLTIRTEERGGIYANGYYFYSDEQNTITPWDYENLGDYGLVYIFTHASEKAFYVCFSPYTYSSRGILEHSQAMKEFKEKYGPKYDLIKYPYGVWGEDLVDLPSWYLPHIPRSNGLCNKMVVTYLTREFFKTKNDNPATNFEGSVIYINSCDTEMLNETLPETYPEEPFRSALPAFSTAKLFFGNNGPADFRWMQRMGYYFFHYMMYGPVVPELVPGCSSTGPYPGPFSDDFEPNKPMHAKEAIDTLSGYGVNPDPQEYKEGEKILGKSHCKTVVLPENSTDKVYFPGKVDVTIDKK
jgi:hypothetical protein